jgi:fructan beta-fructosidase
VSINPGGPNGGSATQYFTGDFDGHTFTPFETDIRWIDYGPDDYAGVTWSNTGNRKIFLGWMSNWKYGMVVPTTTWRSAMTMPRDLRIEKVGDKYMVASTIVPEAGILEEKPITADSIDAGNFILTQQTGALKGPARLDFNSDSIQSFFVTLSNKIGQKLVVGYDKEKNNYFIDRTASGKNDFHKEFGGIYTAPRISSAANLDVTLFIDNASVELIADEGLTVMTAIFFPDELFSDITIKSPEHLHIKNLKFSGLKTIWNK